MTEKLLSDVKYNFELINENIAKAAERSGRKREDITFLAATKTVDVAVINYAISLGLDHIGENKVQELLSKYDSYDLESCSLQFIGHLQTNKVRQLVGKVDLIQSVDSLKLANEIARQSRARNITTDILVEVNVGNEEGKSGVAVEQAEELLFQLCKIDGISVKGLMSIPPICENTQKILKYFNKMRNLFLDIKSKNIDNISMDILSMGMSSDYQQAISEGATMVRIGSLLFGERIYK